MTKKLTKKIIIASGVLVIAALALGLRANVIKLQIEREIHTQFAADFSDDRILMGGSHNVFVGKVTQEVGNKRSTSIPNTQFEVEVVENIKGALEGTVVVNQEGGYKDGVLYTVHGGDVITPSSSSLGGQLLIPGETYLFAARYDPSEDWYTLNSHPNAKKLISQDSKLSLSQLQAIAQSDEKVLRWEEAYRNEILLDSDIINNNTRNSYESLQQSSR